MLYYSKCENLQIITINLFWQNNTTFIKLSITEQERESCLWNQRFSFELLHLNKQKLIVLIKIMSLQTCYYCKLLSEVAWHS